LQGGDGESKILICGIDTETTSKLSPDHRIIELHLQKWDFDPVTFERKKISDKTWRINPERSIDPKAYAVHKISLDDLAGKPNFAACGREIVAAMADVDLFVGHNGDEFDRIFLRLEIERTMPDLLPALDGQKWFDTMQNGRWATPWGKAPTLAELAFATDVPYDTTEAHAAEYDVDRTMRCFFFGIQTGFFVLR